MTIKHLNPKDLHSNPAFSQVIVTKNISQTIYIGGQNAVTASGEIIGKNDIAKQTKQVFHNLEVALAAAGAKLEHIIKWNIYILQGQDPRPAFEEFQRIWGARPNPPLVTVLFVAGLANPDFLLEIDAIAAIDE